jgi:hypothetical protein
VGGGGGGEEGPGLPTTLQEFSANNKGTSQNKIFDPPKAPDNPKETAPQRYPAKLFEIKKQTS